MAVITIGREFGAGGDKVGRMLSEKLGWDLLDTKIMEEVGRRLKLGKDLLAEYDEKSAGLLDRLLRQLASVDLSTPQDVAAWTPPYSDPAFDLNRSVLAITQEVIKRAAAGNAVIVGRGGAYILRDHPDVLSVFLRADEEFRVREVMKDRSLSEAEARKLTRESQANWQAYINQVYGHDVHKPGHYDLVIDVGRIGHLRAVETILAAAPR